MTPEAPFHHGLSPTQIVVTTTLYLAFAAYCAAEAYHQYRTRGKVGSDVAWIVALSAVFAFCDVTGYVPQLPGVDGAWTAWSHPALNLATLALVAYSLWRRPLRQIGRLEHRAEAAEASRDTGARIMREAMDIIARDDTRLFAVYEIVAEPAHVHGIDLRALSVAQGFLDFFESDARSSEVDGRSHYDIFPEINPRPTASDEAPLYIQYHDRTARGEDVTSETEGGSTEFRGKRFTYAHYPLGLGLGPTLPGEDEPRPAGLLIECTDFSQTDALEARLATVIRERDRAAAEAQRNAEAFREADAAARAAGAALGERNAARLTPRPEADSDART